MSVRPFDGKYTITTSHHRYDPNTGYTTSFSVTGRQERSLYGLASGGGGSRLRAGPGDRPGQRRQRPGEAGQGEADLPVVVRHLRQRLGPNRAARRRARTAARWCCPRSATRCWCCSSRATSAGRMSWAVSTTGSTRRPPTGPTLIDGSSGAINRRSIVSRRGHRIDLIDEDGRTEGITLSTTGDKLQLKMDSVDTKITVHSDGKILIEGKGGVDDRRGQLQARAQGQRGDHHRDQRSQDRRRQRCGQARQHR